MTTLVLGYFVLLPEEYKLLGKHTFGGSTYINNFMLYKETGNYFNVDSKFKPLLHLWSLGVEEQFYIVFPIFLWVIYKLNLNFVLSLALFSIVSFFINYNAVKHGFVSKAFFMPWSRFWELSLGAVLAYVEFEYAKQLYQFKDSKFYKTVLAIIFRNPSDSDNQKSIKNIISFIGLALIVVGLISIKSNGVYPGKKALIPVLGAIFIIAAGKEAFINRKLLSNKVMVFLGLISYPLYLWHWPLLSLLYICDGGIPERHLKVIAILISLVLATITFLFIEPKLRYGKHGGIKAIALFVVLLVVGCVGLKVFFDNKAKLQDHYWAEKTKIYKSSFFVEDQYIANCNKVMPEWKRFNQALNCAFMKKDGENKVALIGSSHASHLFNGLTRVFNDSDTSIAMFAMDDQSPFLHLSTQIEPKQKWFENIDLAYQYVTSHNEIEVVVLADIKAPYVDADNPNEQDYESILTNAVTRSFEKLKSKKVLVLLDNPWVPFDPKLCNSRPFSISREPQCTFDYENKKYEKPYYDMLHKDVISKVAKLYPNVSVYDLNPLFCKDGVCHVKMNGENLFRDNNHLSVKGSQYVAPFIAEQIKKVLNRVPQD